MSITHPPTPYTFRSDAEYLASLLNSEEDNEWSYVAVDFGTRYAIEIYDEDGIRLGYM